MKHFLLINPSAFWSRWAEGDEARAHLNSLYSYLRTHNSDVEIDYLDLKDELGYPQSYDEIDTFLEAAEVLLRQHELDVVGLSCWTSVEYLCTLAVGRVCKRINPKCTIVVGGYHPSIMPEDFIFDGAPINFIVCGEGELALSELLRTNPGRPETPQLIRGRPLKMEDEVILVDDNPIFQNSGTFSVFLSRGCPFVCKFCIEGSLPTSSWRAHSPDRALAVVDAVAASRRFKGVSFNDPIFAVNKEWRRAFLSGLATRGHDLTYWAETRHDLLDRMDIELLSQLEGSFTLDLGLDGASHHILAVMKKTNTPEKYLERFVYIDGLMNHSGLFHSAYLIVNYPGETSASIDQAKGFFHRLFDSREENYTFVGFGEFFLTPGCDVWDNMDDYRQRYGFEHLSPWWWKLENCDQYRQARMVVPSRSLLAEGRLAYGRQAVREIAERARRDMPSRVLNRARDPEEIYPRSVARRPGASRQASPPSTELLESFDLMLVSEARLCSGAEESYLVSMSDGGIANGGGVEQRRESVNRVKVLTPDAAEVVKELAVGVNLGQLVASYGEANRGALERLVSELLAEQLLEIGCGHPPEESMGSYKESGTPEEMMIRTSKGVITVSLFGANEPVQTRWFLHLARLGVLDGAAVDLSLPGRIEVEIKGGVKGDSRVRLGGMTTMDTTVRPGTVALARTSAKGIGTKWLISLKDRPDWCGRHALIGQVKEADLPILLKLEPGDRVESVHAGLSPPGSRVKPILCRP